MKSNDFDLIILTDSSHLEPSFSCDSDIKENVIPFNTIHIT
jgi:hypothetical protein